MNEHEIAFVDMHTAGEPVRMITRGYPALEGRTILERRREARQHHDHIRRALMLEPRGHAGMYGVILMPPCDPRAVASVLFTHHEGYSTMCGHATIALGRFLVDEGYVPKTEPVTRFAIEAPCGLLDLAVSVVDGRAGAVRFTSVPAFVHGLDIVVEVPRIGSVLVDIAYGGAFYAILPSSRLGLDFRQTLVGQLTEAAGAITDAIRATVPVRHPQEPDLGFLYGTILTDDSAGLETSANLCVFAERQIDRSPTGSGVTARMALDLTRGNIVRGAVRRFTGISGEAFTGCIPQGEGDEAAGIRVEVGGEAFYAARGHFLVEQEERLGYGFDLARRFGDLPRPHDDASEKDTPPV